MEYRYNPEPDETNGWSDWNAVYAEKLTGFMAGTYEVRTAATNKAPASESISLQIKDQGEVLDEDLPEDGVPEGIWIAGVKDLDYTGKALTQDFRLYDGNKRLTEKLDYTVSYKNNKKAFKVEYTETDPKEPTEESKKKGPSISIKMKGNYDKTRIVCFSINAQDIDTGEFSVSDITTAYNGRKQTPAPVVTWNGKKLRAGTDFTVKEYVEAKEDKKAFVGDPDTTKVYDLTVVGIGNFTGSREITLTIAGKANENVPVVMMKDVKATSIPEQTYTGNEFTLETLKNKKGTAWLGFAVNYRNKELTEGIDYEAEFVDAREAGTATLILRGLVETKSATGFCFAGEKRLTFKIAGLKMSGAKVNGLAKSYGDRRTVPRSCLPIPIV
ncbi:MAG: hypothetical protein K6G27_01445 [Lachnospiraceae bacterium]|nr:hypothetical protein [Lachnospiraceae bacterium]